MIQQKADCYLYSSLDEQVVKAAMLTPATTPCAVITQVLEKTPGASVAVLPQGPLSIPFVK